MVGDWREGFAENRLPHSSQKHEKYQNPSTIEGHGMLFLVPIY